MSVGTSERDSVLYMLSRFKGKPTIIDVGSNKGTWSDIVLDELKEDCNIHLFEPNELLLNFTRVKYDYKKNITYNLLAAYKEDGKQLDFFYFTNENNGLSGIYHNPQWDYLPMQKGEINSITIDTYCKKNNLTDVDCIKIDVEGAECDVLIGCDWLLREKKVKCIQIEYSPHYKLTNRTFKEVIDIAGKYGYFVYSWDSEWGFIKVGNDNFKEDYELRNYLLSYMVMEKYTQRWNNEFKINTSELPKVDLALEIGCFEGLTTNYICDNLLNEGGRVICIDPLEDNYYVDNLSDKDKEMNNELSFFKGQYERFLSNTKGKPVNLIRKKSKDAYEDVKDLRFQFIYIDGDHRKEGVYHDCTKYIYCMKVGGYMLIDDYEWREETKEGVDLFLKEAEGQYELMFKNYQVLIKKTKHIEYQ